MPALPFQRLEDRLAGHAPTQTLVEGVPEWLEEPLRDWVWNVVGPAHPGNHEETAKDVLLALRWKSDNDERDREARTLRNSPTDDLLTVVDAIVQFHPVWETISEHKIVTERAIDDLFKLGALLEKAGSNLKYSFPDKHLVRRVDESAQQGYRNATKDRKTASSQHLRKAWDTAYRRDPDPDVSYSESMKAVEAALNPLVSPKDKFPTIGKTLATLRKQCETGKWELELGGPDDQERNIKSFIGMVDLMIKNHDSRHGGGPHARNQTQGEAEAVLHLAILIVQWVNTGTLKRR